MGEPTPAPATLGPTEARLAATESRCVAAFRGYEGAPMRGAILLLRAARLSNWLVLDPRDSSCGWGRMTRGEVVTRTLDCEHLDVFTEPHIGTLGHLIQEACTAPVAGHGAP